jgi:ketosteroid isomerase-like protein
MARNPNLEEMPTQPPPADDLGVQDYLQSFASAITAGDGQAIAAMWETPAFVLGAEMARVIEKPEDVAALFGGAREQYNAIGIVDTKPEIVRLDEINDGLVMVRVHWPWLDDEGRQVGAETSTYTLARNGDGEWRLRIAVMHGAEAVN